MFLSACLPIPNFRPKTPPELGAFSPYILQIMCTLPHNSKSTKMDVAFVLSWAAAVANNQRHHRRSYYSLIQPLKKQGEKNISVETM